MLTFILGFSGDKLITNKQQFNILFRGILNLIKSDIKIPIIFKLFAIYYLIKLKSIR